MQDYKMTDESLGTVDVKDLTALDSETSFIMKSELKTGVGLSLFYYIFIFSIPVMNWFLHDLAFSNIWGGMSLTWFLTTIVAVAMAFLIAYIHTHLYEKRLQMYESKESKGGRSA